MAVDENNTTPNDALIIRKSPFVFLKMLVLIEFFFAILPFGVAWFLGVAESYESYALSQSVSYTLLAALVMALLQILIIGSSFAFWYFPTYLVDSARVLYQRANLFDDRRLADTQSIADMDVSQGWLGRRLNYGAILLSTQVGEHVQLKDVSTPARHAATIARLIRPADLAPAMPPPIEKIIDGGENQLVEYKSSLMWDYRQQKVNKALYEPVMKNIVAFMNSTGGTLLIGVDDDGHALGLEPDYGVIKKPNSDGFENVFNMAFNKMIGVEYRQFVDVTFPTVDGKEICRVAIHAAGEPAFLRYQNSETFYIRAGNASQALPISKATRYIQSHFSS